jgi:hypothetical protein
MSTLARAMRPLALGAMVLVCTACVSIPDSSPVSEAPNVSVDDQSQQISNDVPGPQPGAAQAEVVSGFFRAMLAYPQSSAVAREFLTPAAAESWDPRVSTVVYTGLGDFNESGNVISVPVIELGTMNDRGSWTTARSEAATSISSFRLEQVGDEWRISNPAPGTFIDVDYFNRNYDPFSLYFIDPTQRVLTPDPVHLALGDTTATSLVSDLLLGPSPELAGVATNGAPAGTHLDAAVSVSAAGVAEIALSPEFLKLSEEDRGLFAAQLAWTLRQVPNIRTIAITVDGAAVQIEGVSREFSVDEFAGFDPAGLAGDRRLYALGRTGLVAVEPNEITLVPGPAGQVRDARSFAVDTDGSLAAIVARNGRSTVVAGMASGSEQTPVTWIDDATSLLKPSWDQHGVLWAVDRTGAEGGARILAATGDETREVVAQGLTGKDVVAFAVSRDGVRAAAIVRYGDAARLVVSVIDRDAENPSDVSFGALRTVRPAQFTLSTMTSLAWVSPTRLAVLGTFGSGDAQPYAVAIDGSSILASSGLLPATPTTLAAGPNDDAPIAVGDASGRIFVQTPDLRWVPFGGGAKLRAPAYPG